MRMKDIKGNVAKNITALRVHSGMTQLELGERLNYSDKTVSKWERGDSTPDVAVLVELAELFGVTLDALVTAESAEALSVEPPKAGYNRRAIAHIAEGGVWLVAIFAFIITSLILGRASFQWLYFVYAMPVAVIVKLVFNSIWFNPRHNYFIVSALMWSILATIQITFLYFKINVVLLYLLGVAGQIIIILCSRIRH